MALSQKLVGIHTKKSHLWNQEMDNHNRGEGDDGKNFHKTKGDRKHLSRTDNPFSKNAECVFDATWIYFWADVKKTGQTG